MSPVLGVDWSRADDVRKTVQPWVDDGRAPVLQLTVEHAFSPTLPPAFTHALDQAAARGDLVAHGVYGAPFGVPRDAMSHDWLRRTAAVLERWPARWLTDHVGCCRADGWNAAPLPLPLSLDLVDVTRAHLDWIQQTLQIPVGLENLALAVSDDDVLLRPDFLDAALRPIDGVLLLDVHNLWCQAVNSGIDAIELLERYPLDLVRQLHVAGGRWSTHAAGRFRRDTHDGAIPDEVLALLTEAVGRCENLEVVVVERLGGTLADPSELVDDLERVAATLSRPSVRSWRPPDRTPTWRLEPASVQHVVMSAARHGDRSRLEQAIPGWWTDDRAWDVAVEITRRWGRPVDRG